MNALKSLLKIPWILWFLIAIGIAYFDYDKWKTASFDALKSQLQTAEGNYVQAQKDVKQAEEFKTKRDDKLRELQDLGLKLETTKNELPRNANIPDLLRALADVADGSGLEFSKFKPEAPRQKRFLIETPITVTLRGTYLQIMSFLDAAANLTRIVATEKLQIDSPNPRGTVSIVTASAVLVTYHLDEQLFAAQSAPIPQAPPASAPAANPAAPTGAAPTGGGEK